MDDALAAKLHDEDPTALGRRIRDRRLARALTQADLAAEDVTVSYISRIESGSRRPDAELCERFAVRLSTTAAYLITGVEPNRSQEITLELRYAELALESGEPIEAERRTANVLKTDQAILPEQQSEAHYLHARALESQGQLDQAITELEPLVAAVGSERWLAAAIAHSRCLREFGDLTRAIETGESMLAQVSAAGLDGTDEAIQLAVTVAFAYYERGDLGHAMRMCQSAINQADALGSATARGSAYWNASVFESGRGATSAAIPLAERALALLGEGSDVRNLARLRLQLGIMLLRLDPPEHTDALAYLHQARAELSASSASLVDLARCDTAIGRALFAAGDLDGAQRAADQANESSGELSPSVAADALAVLGQIAAAEGNGSQARDLYGAAVRHLTAVGSDRGAAQLWLELGALLDAAGDSEAARDAYLSAAVSTGLRIPQSVTVRR